MILPLLLLAAAQTPPAAADAPAATAACPSAPAFERQICLALGAQKSGESAKAALAFEEAARQLPDTDPRHARALAAAGNMWIAAAEPGKAALALDRALAATGLQAEQRGEALLDRARAAEAQNDLKTARAKVTEAQRTIAVDPFLWYFSAALAIREGNADLAKSSINRALALEPANPTVLFEAGHVYHFAGDEAAARDYWSRAAAADPNGASGRAAAQALKLLETPEQVKSEPSPPK